MEQLILARSTFVTRQCGDTHIGYAMSQIKKARGQNEWINNPKPNARLADFPIHFAAEIGSNAAQLHVQPVAGAAAGQTEDKFNPRLFQRMMLSNDAAAMPL